MRIRQATRALCALAALTALAWVFVPAASAADAGLQARELFLDPDGRLMCAARGGDTLNYPANSQQAFESSAGTGVDIITTTARLTKDGEFVLAENENTLGAWVDGECEVLKVTRTMVFAQGLVRADGATAVRCSGVFKIGPKFGDDAR